MAKIMVIAHRGASAYKPENTLSSFRLAVELGADMVEFDVQQSKDGHLIVFHDERLERTTSGKGFVRDLTLKELKDLNACLEYKIPTLNEAIAFLAGKVGLVIEIKILGIEKKVVETIKRSGVADDVIITSFFHLTVKKIKSICSKIQTGVIVSSRPVNPLNFVFDAEADAMFPKYRYVDEELVLKAHKYGVHIFPWTVDSMDDIEKLAKMGVDGVVTNRPDMAISKLSSLGFR